VCVSAGRTDGQTDRQPDWNKKRAMCLYNMSIIIITVLLFFVLVLFSSNAQHKKHMCVLLMSYLVFPTLKAAYDLRWSINAVSYWWYVLRVCINSLLFVVLTFYVGVLCVVLMDRAQTLPHALNLIYWLYTTIFTRKHTKKHNLRKRPALKF